jgi:GNAT superfamily N-acetyltransferase
MDGTLCARHLKRYADSGFPVFVAESQGGEVVGEVEVWFDEEPAPFGRYAEVEMIVTHPDLAGFGIERRMLEFAAKKVIERGYRSLDISPEHSGGSYRLLEELGFRSIWDTRCFRASVEDIAEPKAKYRCRRISTDYDIEAKGTIPLCHYEPSRFHWENRLGDGMAYSKRVHSMLVQKMFRGRVELKSLGKGFVLLIERWRFLHDTVHVEVWAQLDTRSLESNRAFIEGVGRAVTEIVSGLGVERFEFYAPWFCRDWLRGIGFEGGDERDLWMRRTLK